MWEVDVGLICGFFMLRLINNLLPVLASSIAGRVILSALTMMIEHELISIFRYFFMIFFLRYMGFYCYSV